jgi:hypothetical protein
MILWLLITAGKSAPDGIMGVTESDAEKSCRWTPRGERCGC